MKITDLKVWVTAPEGGRSYVYVQIDTDEGIHGIGEATSSGGGGSIVVGNMLRFLKDSTLKQDFRESLVGENPEHVDRIWHKLYRRFTGGGGSGGFVTTMLSGIDIALWDLAGKLYDAPIFELLGGWKSKIPAYASTMHGDRNGGLDSPEAYAQFAVECKEMGYPAFKIHGWGDYNLDEEIETITKVREAVGSDMDLMLDPACEINTFLETVKIGKACDEANYLWLEDPYKDTGISIHGHKMLKGLIKTPLLQTEHIRGLEEHVNFIQSGATDIVRVDPLYDGGITGALKIAYAAEGFGLDCEVHAPGPAQRHLIASI